jgi:hypothetical protein
MALYSVAVCSLCRTETRVPAMVGSGFWRRRLPPGGAIVTTCSTGFDHAEHWCPDCLARARSVARGMEAAG